MMKENAGALPGQRLASSYPFNGRRYTSMQGLVNAFAESPRSWDIAKQHLKRGNINTWLQKIDEFDLDVQIFSIVRTHQDPDLQIALLIAKFSREPHFYYKSHLITPVTLSRYHLEHTCQDPSPDSTRICSAFLNGTLKRWFQIICDVRGGNEDPLLGMGLVFPERIRDLDLSPDQRETATTLYLQALAEASREGSDGLDIDRYLSSLIGLYYLDKELQTGLPLIDAFLEIMGDSPYMLEIKNRIRADYTSRIRQEQQETILQEGLDSLKEGRIDEAVRNIDMAIGINQDFPKAWMYKGKVLADQQLLEEALMAFDRALSLEPDNPRVLSLKGTALCGMGRYQEAIGAFTRAIERDPACSRLLCSIGHALCSLDQWSEALPALEKGLKADPENAMAWKDRGDVLFHLSRYQECIRAYARAKKIDSGCRISWKNLADAFFSLQRYEQAVKAVTHHLRGEPGDARSWNMKGMAQFHLNKFRDAAESLEKAFELDPADPEIIHNHSRFQIETAETRQ